MLVSIGAYDICNGTLAGGVAIGQARINFDRVKDVAIPIDQVDPDIFDRVCHRLTFTFQVQRTHANAATAELFVLDLDTNLPSSGTVTLTPTGSATTRTIPDGNVISHQSNLLGATTTTTYTIVGGQPT
jgi:hypothetical protein